MIEQRNIYVVVKAVIVRDGYVLLVHRTGRNRKWECPGGKMEFGEHLEDAMIREVYEETKLNIHVNALLYAESMFAEPGKQLVILTYLCETDEESVILSDEHDDYCWAGRRQLYELIAPDIRVHFSEHGLFEREDLCE
ncbi:NUDIX hydrolase [Salisediminibacterium halotolerans]|nr:NUDIX domain-containing protein [Salisediminibacterium haloalkalitolerans]